MEQVENSIYLACCIQPEQLACVSRSMQHFIYFFFQSSTSQHLCKIWMPLSCASHYLSGTSVSHGNRKLIFFLRVTGTVYYPFRKIQVSNFIGQILQTLLLLFSPLSCGCVCYYDTQLPMLVLPSTSLGKFNLGLKETFNLCGNMSIHCATRDRYHSQFYKVNIKLNLTAGQLSLRIDTGNKSKQLF